MINCHPLSKDLDSILEQTWSLWESLRGQRLFITGGTGFFGRWMLESLCWTSDRLRHGVRATVLSRYQDGISRRVPHLEGHSALDLCVGDIATFVPPSGSYDAVIHMAALPDGPVYRQRPVEMKATLVEGARHVAECAGEWGVRRFLHLSSGTVYGQQPANVDRLVENAPFVLDKPGENSAYREGKRTAEELVTQIAIQRGFDAIIARPFAFIGPYIPIGPGFAAGEFLKQAICGQPIHVAGDGTPIRTYLYAADLAVWLWTLLVKGKANTAYNVGGDDTITIADLARTIGSTVNPPLEVEVLGTPVSGQSPQRYVPDTRRARDLGLRAQIPLPEAIRRTLDWLRWKPQRHAVVEQDIQRILDAPLPWEQFFGKTVLVAGAAGFLPAYMVEAILALNERNPRARIRVLALVRNRSRAERRFAIYRNRTELEFVVQDVCERLPQELRADFVIHAASQASPKYYGVDPVGTIAPNAIGTANLLELARKSGSESFLFFSTSEVYGTPTQVPTTEDTMGLLDPIDVRSCYGESKRLGENLCVAYAHQYGVQARIVRPFHTYGPGMKLDDGRVFADFVADIVANRSIVLKSAGTATRAFCYLADAVIGFFAVLMKGAVGQAYNVGNPDCEISIRELASLLVGLFPNRGLSVVCDEVPRENNYLSSPVNRSCPDVLKIRALGWRPTTSLADGFRRTVQSYS